MILGGPRAALGKLLGGVLVLSWVALGWSWAILVGPSQSWSRLGSVLFPSCGLGSISDRFGAPLGGVLDAPGVVLALLGASFQIFRSRFGVLDAFVPVENR